MMLKDMTLKGEPPRSAGVQYAPGEKQRNCFRRDKQAEPKQKQHLVVDDSGGESKVQCCKEQYCIGTWNVRHMNQGKLGMIKQELFQILKDDAVKAFHSICQHIWKTQQWPQDWKRLVFIPIPKKGNAKEHSNYHTIALVSHASNVMLKIPQARLQ